MLKTKLEEALALADGQPDVVTLIEQAIALLPAEGTEGGVSTQAASGGGGHGVPGDG